ncbi:hypothetical protein [Poseidonocella sp. HB161398]|uniref:hypothetical protein n=1 Tax=Poseidonocella sp. HB161398 TaxID=2320855 RepID=UPI001109A7FB|nr:hypothetical protein [Poseidonocella sp. HB161398]
MQDRQLRAERLLAAADGALAAGAHGAALERYRQVFAMGLESWPMHVNAAQCLKRQGDLAAAFAHFDRAFALKRLRPGRSAPREAANPLQLKHLEEQLGWLERTGRIAAQPAGGPAALAETCLLRAAPDIPETMLSERLSVQRIALSGGAGDAIYVIDNLLSPGALAGLAEQLLGSTFWFDARAERHYLGAHLHDGLATPFMLALARAMHAVTERLAGPVRVAQLWAFRYLRESRGIDIHADQGDWNLNLWPVSEAFLEPGGQGGMTLWDLRIGADIPFAEYNARPDLNRSRIAAAGAAAHQVPYRGNRAVLFPSRYLHRTDAARFSEAFEGRRINVTMMADRTGDAA